MLNVEGFSAVHGGEEVKGFCKRSCRGSEPRQARRHPTRPEGQGYSLEFS